jgi:hypothetical protein
MTVQRLGHMMTDISDLTIEPRVVRGRARAFHDPEPDGQPRAIPQVKDMVWAQGDSPTLYFAPNKKGEWAMLDVKRRGLAYTYYFACDGERVIFCVPGTNCATDYRQRRWYLVGGITPEDIRVFCRKAREILGSS